LRSNRKRMNCDDQTVKVRNARETPADSSRAAGHASYVTISVDDGHPLDIRTAELFIRYGIAATFYVPARNPERRVLTPPQLREIAQNFEIGSHTLNHLPLNTVTRERAWLEISEGKAWLQDVLSKPVTSFCYPRGKYTRAIVDMVERAGFVGARTCAFNRTDFPENPYRFGVSTQAHNHGRGIQIRHALLERNFQGALNFVKVYRTETNWQNHFRMALDEAETKGGVAHLTMHSWEIEENGDWGKFEEALRMIAQRPKLIRVTNGELYAQWAAEHPEYIAAHASTHSTA
jgi:peptidoglycan-N-acetylglucosamine deacetylase